MILEIDEVKQWLRIDDNGEDQVLKNLIIAAEEYLKNATGKIFDSKNQLARLFCLYLITDWYENREFNGKKVGEETKYIVQSMINQLKYGEMGEGE